MHCLNKGNPIAVFKLASVIVGILVMCALMEMFFTGGYQQGRTLADAYARGAAGNAGGGWIGGVIVMALGSMFGTIGAYLVLIVLLAICVVCITEKSLVSFVKKGSGRAYQYAKEDVDRRRVEHQERKEERQRLREERRVRGVNLDSTKLTAREPDPRRKQSRRIDSCITGACGLCGYGKFTGWWKVWFRGREGCGW